MKLLTINSSEKQAQICLKTDEKEILHLMDDTKSHSEFLLQEIDDLLFANNLTITDIDSLSVNIGPGSFTGIRIGISFVKAFLSVKNYKATTVNNFELINYNIPNKTDNYFILLSSNNEDFYYANFVNDKIIYGFSNSTNFNENINKNNHLVFCNSLEKDAFVSVNNLTLINVKAESMLKVSINKIEQNLLSNINEISPLYIKKSQAEQGLQDKINKLLEIKEESSVNELVVLEKKCFELEAYSENLLKQDLENKNNKMYFAYYNDELIGYINFNFCLDEINLLKICVLPEFREYKIASKLMEQMLEFAKQNNIVNLFLEVDSKNIPAIKLYEKYKFQKIDVRKNYYKNGNDAIIYKKSV